MFGCHRLVSGEAGANVDRQAHADPRSARRSCTAFIDVELAIVGIISTTQKYPT